MPLPAVFAHLFFRFVVVICTARTASFFLWRPVAALLFFFLCVCRLFCQVRFIFTGLFFSVVFIFRDAHNFFFYMCYCTACLSVRTFCVGYGSPGNNVCLLVPRGA